MYAVNWSKSKWIRASILVLICYPMKKKNAKKQEIFPLNSLFGVKDHLGHLLFCDDKKIFLLYTWKKNAIYSLISLAIDNIFVCLILMIFDGRNCLLWLKVFENQLVFEWNLFQVKLLARLKTDFPTGSQNRRRETELRQTHTHIFLLSCSLKKTSTRLHVSSFRVILCRLFHFLRGVHMCACNGFFFWF